MKMFYDKKIATWDDKSIISFWDYTSNFEQKYFAYQVGDVLLSFCEKYLKKDSKILDYGAGLGFITEKLINKGNNVAALDFSLKTIEKLNNTFKLNNRFIGAFDSETIRGIGIKFDVIFITEVIEHLNDYYLNILFEDVLDLLSENGKLIITTPNKEVLEDSYIYCPFSDIVFHRWQHVRSWDKEKLSAYLQKKGFDQVEIIQTHLLNKPKWVGLNRKTLANILDYLKLKVEGKKPHLLAIAKRK